MKVQGIVGSRRKMDNSEILVKEALLGARRGRGDQWVDRELLSCEVRVRRPLTN